MTTVHTMYHHLLKEYGPQGWWPIKGNYHKKNYNIPYTEEEQFEICIGAILTQNTAWTNVEKALTQLGNITLKRIANMPKEQLAQAIKPTGYFNQKTERIQEFAHYILKKHGTLNKMFTQDTETLREELLTLKGIGPETADSIILYAAKKTIFVIDTYTKRIMERIGLTFKDYNDLQQQFHKELSPNTPTYNEYHALIVEHAKQHCTKNKPTCETCPLIKQCEHGKQQKTSHLLLKNLHSQILNTTKTNTKL